MKLRYVTLTGADDRTNASKMAELSAKYPFVEWAILFSQNKTGNSRYPTDAWIDEAMPKLLNANLSAHLCGKWVDDALRLGKVTFLNDDLLSHHFGRIQFNMARDRLQKVLNFETRFWECNLSNYEIILGGPFQKYNMSIPTDKFRKVGVSPLFDGSGGRGILAAEWPKPVCDEYGKPLFCGYAGGLGPDNIEAELNRIEAVVGDAEIWVDMESKLRNNKDEFDLEKCERVLAIAQRWMDK